MHKKAVCLSAVLLLTLPMESLAAAVDMDPGGTPFTDSHEIMYNVSFPADIHAYLDPGNLSGRGQVFSDRYTVENHGNTDVVIKIKNINIYYSSTEEICEFSEDEILDDHSHIKKLNVEMVWENEEEQMEKVLHVSEGEPEEYVLYLAAPQCEETEEAAVAEGSSVGTFYFSGTLSSAPELVWEDSEIVVSFGYEIISAEHDEMGEAVEELLGTAWYDADSGREQGAGETEEGELLGDVVEEKSPEETDSEITGENKELPEAGETVPKKDAADDKKAPETEDKALEGEGSADKKEIPETEDKSPEEGSTDGEEASEGQDVIPEGSADGKETPEAEDKAPEGEEITKEQEPSETGDEISEGEGAAGEREPSETESTIPEEKETADEKEISGIEDRIPEGAADEKESSYMEQASDMREKE